MKKLTAPKEVFQHIVDNPIYLKQEYYICRTLRILNLQTIISESLKRECTLVLCENKPNEQQFVKYYRSPFYIGLGSWWKYRSDIDFLKRELVLKEKISYLKDLIKTL